MLCNYIYFAMVESEHKPKKDDVLKLKKNEYSIVDHNKLEIWNMWVI